MSKRIRRRWQQWRCRHFHVSRVSWIENERAVNKHGPALVSEATCKDCGKSMPDSTSIFSLDETIRHLNYARSLVPGTRMEICWNEWGEHYKPMH